MSDRRFEIALEEYDDATRDVMGSNSNTFSTNFERWFEVIDEDSDLCASVRELEGNVDFKDWYENAKSTIGSMAGSGELRWPAGSVNRISMQLALMRGISNNNPRFLQFYQGFMGGSSRFDDMIYDFTGQIFGPMSRDLRKYFVRRSEMREADPEAPVVVPASDRTVALDHNSPVYREAVDALESVETALKEANDIEPDDREQRLAEVGAGRRLLQATRVRAEAAVSLVYRALKYLAKQFADKAIGAAAVGALALLGKATGLW